MPRNVVIGMQSTRLDRGVDFTLTLFWMKSKMSATCGCRVAVLCSRGGLAWSTCRKERENVAWVKPLGLPCKVKNSIRIGRRSRSVRLLNISATSSNKWNMMMMNTDGCLINYSTWMIRDRCSFRMVNWTRIIKAKIWKYESTLSCFSAKQAPPAKESRMSS